MNHDKPLFADVDAGVSEGVVQLFGDGGILIANLPGDRAETLRDGLNDAIRERKRQAHLVRPLKKALILAANLRECQRIAAERGLDRWGWEQLHNPSRQLAGTFRREVLVAPNWGEHRPVAEIDNIMGLLQRTEAVISDVR